MFGYEIGMWLEKNSAVRVASNHIYESAPSTGHSDANHLIGIAIDKDNSSIIQENYFKYNGFGAKLYNSNINSEFHCNTFYKNRHQVYGDHFSLTQQGAPLLDEAWDNFFDDLVTTNDRIAGRFPLQTINWFHQGSSSTSSQFFPSGQSNIVSQIFANNSDPTCVHPIFISPPDERKERYLDIAESGENIVFSDTIYSDYYNKTFYYESISLDTTVLNLNDSSDSFYQNLYDSLKQTNIKNYYDIGIDLKNGDFEDALDKLGNTNDQNILEENLKIVYSIFAETNLDRNQMDSTQRTAMEEIAYQKAVFGGDAVYYARAYLSKLIVDEFNEEGLKIRNPLKNEHSDVKPNLENLKNFSNIRIVPNPATNIFSIVMHEPLDEKMTFQILDLYGRVLSLNVLPKGTINYPVNTEKLVSGSYFIRFYSSDIFIGQNKLIISK